MNKEEWNKLNDMHHKLKSDGLMSFSSKFLERYSELLAKSLRGKGNGCHERTNTTRT